MKLTTSSLSKPFPNSFINLVFADKPIQSIIYYENDRRNLIINAKANLSTSLYGNCNNQSRNNKEAGKNDHLDCRIKAQNSDEKKDPVIKESFGKVYTNIYESEPFFALQSQSKENVLKENENSAMDNNNNFNNINAIPENKNTESVDRGDIYYFDSECFEIFVRVPAENILDNVSYDMELQLTCFGKPKFVDITSSVYSQICFPVKITSDDTKESMVFKNISSNDIKENGVISISGLDEVLNDFSTTQGVVYYKGMLNFPDCADERLWFVLTKPLLISQSKFDKFKILAYTEFAPDGNNRKPSAPAKKGTPNIYYINYSK